MLLNNVYVQVTEWLQQIGKVNSNSYGRFSE